MRNIPKDNRSHQIMEAAIKLFAEKGYYKTTTAEIANSIGVTQPYIFHFFKSKEGLYIEVLRKATRLITSEFASVEVPPEQLKEKMGDVFNHLLADNRSEILLTMLSASIPDPAIKSAACECFDEVYRVLVTIFEQAGFPNPGYEASMFIGQGLSIAVAETLKLPHLTEWVC